jgi:RimJ/RimL family protein N-acetyltransferase
MEVLECAMNKLKKIIRFITPRVETYIVLSSTANQVVEITRKYSLPTEYELENITPALRSSIEKDRPGYWRMANKYLDAGHKGLCICHGSTVTAMAWLYHNSDGRRKHVTYYPLEPNHVWFHAAWVNPTYRGRGLHKSLLYHRAVYLQTMLGDIVVESNVDPNNIISLHNCEKAGFRRERMLYVMRIGGLRLCWQNHLNL